MAKYRTILKAGIAVFGLKELLFDLAVKHNLDINIQTAGFISKTHLITIEGKWNEINQFIHAINRSIKHYNNEP